MQTPFLIKEPSELLCSVSCIYFGLRYALTGLQRHFRIAAMSLCCLAGTVLTYWVASMEGLLITHRYDLYIYRFDQLFGVEPGEALGRVILAHTWGVWSINFFYGLLAAAVMFLLIAYEPLPEFREVFYSILICLALAPLFYALFPVSGPRFAFDTFPALPASVAPHIIYLQVAPNGIPSIHFALALLIWWYSRRWLVGYILAGAFVVLTDIATLASGQHYVFDLVVAVPYTIGVIALSRLLLRRSRGPAVVADSARRPVALNRPDIRMSR